MLACNSLVLDEKSITFHTDLPHLEEAVWKDGQEVIETPFDAVYQFCRRISVLASPVCERKRSIKTSDATACNAGSFKRPFFIR